MGYILIPIEWQTLYSHFPINKRNTNIDLHIRQTLIDFFENTYGAERTGNRKHQGTDICAPVFSPIIIVNDGTILNTGRNILGGNIVEILGDDRRIYYYAHLTNYLEFNVGDKIKRGETIGFVSSTGNAIYTLAHLHFEIKEIDWLFPLITCNINPYPQLVVAA